MIEILMNMEFLTEETWLKTWSHAPCMTQSTNAWCPFFYVFPFIQIFLWQTLWEVSKTRERSDLLLFQHIGTLFWMSHILIKIIHLLVKLGSSYPSYSFRESPRLTYSGHFSWDRWTKKCHLGNLFTAHLPSMPLDAWFARIDPCCQGWASVFKSSPPLQFRQGGCCPSASCLISLGLDFFVLP